MIVGILGGGQLGLMMILEGVRLNLTFKVLDDDPGAPASRLARVYSRKELGEFVESIDVATFEFEHIDLGIAEKVAELGKLRPSVSSLKVKQSKISERLLLRELGIPTPRFRIVESQDELSEAIEDFRKAVVKVPTGAYDGKGQHYVKYPSSVDLRNYPLLVDEWVDIAKEFSVIAVRSLEGEVKFYPITENYHWDGILLFSIAPASVSEEIASRAREWVLRLMSALNYVGVIAVEFFLSRNGDLMVNEFAPRVHNSGHWTLDGAQTSQFENHLRAILGMPLGSTDPMSPTGMVNILGLPWIEETMRKVMSIPGTSIWWYGKSTVRPRRKMGHINVRASTRLELEGKIREILGLLYGPRGGYPTP